MQLTANKEKIKIKKWDWLLIIGLMLAPMTGLRVWKVGPAEILCLIWGLRYFPRPTLKMNIVIKFFVGFVCAMVMGSFVGALIAPSELSKLGTLTWLYLAFIACAIYEGLKGYKLEYIYKLLRVFARLSIIWYLFLYFYSITISKSFLGAPLWYGGLRFTAGATNPHQIAVMMCGLCFVFLSFAVKKQNVLINLACAAASVYIILQTESSTGNLSIAVGVMCFVYLWTAFSSVSSRKALLAIEIIATLLVVLIFHEAIFSRISHWISSDSNGDGRIEIFKTITRPIKISPIFGLGPGIHALGGIIEFHNTYLEIIAATGFIGAAIFILFTIRSFARLWKAEWSFIPVMAAMYAYGIAGFAMRRLAYWGIMTFILVIAEKAIEAKKEAEKEKDTDAQEDEKRYIYNTYGDKIYLP